MEAVLTNQMELTTFPFALGKDSFDQNSRNGSKINIKKNIYIFIYLYLYLSFCTEILFQLTPFVIKLFTNERCESNQFQVEEKMEYSLIESFTPS